jgi:hypothetical protein
MAQRIRHDPIDQEEIDRALDVARYFLRLALDPPLMPGTERAEAIQQTIERLALLSADELRSLAHKHRAHPATRHAVQALNRAAISG